MNLVINCRELRLQAVYMLKESGETRITIHETPDNSVDMIDPQRNIPKASGTTFCNRPFENLIRGIKFLFKYSGSHASSFHSISKV